MTCARKSVISLSLIGASLASAMLLAQMPASGTILLAMGMNVKQVVQYEWKQRVTVIRKGTPSEPIINQVRFDSSGQMQRTTISAPEEKQMGGIRGKIASGVKENVKAIMELTSRYNKPQQMAEAVKKAQISPERGTDALQLTANNLIEPGDSMTMLVNSSTHLATHLEIRTDYEGGPMTIAQDYSPVPGGPNMMRSMTVSVPHQGLVVKVDSYEFERQTASLRR